MEGNNRLAETTDQPLFKLDFYGCVFWSRVDSGVDASFLSATAWQYIWENGEWDQENHCICLSGRGTTRKEYFDSQEWQEIMERKYEIKDEEEQEDKVEKDQTTEIKEEQQIKDKSCKTEKATQEVKVIEENEEEIEVDQSVDEEWEDIDEDADEDGQCQTDVPLNWKKTATLDLDTMDSLMDKTSGLDSNGKIQEGVRLIAMKQIRFDKSHK